MFDGGPYETVKDSEYSMLGSASFDESTENVMVVSTVGPATQINIVVIKFIMTCGTYNRH